MGEGRQLARWNGGAVGVANTDGMGRQLELPDDTGLPKGRKHTPRTKELNLLAKEYITPSLHHQFLHHQFAPSH